MWKEIIRIYNILKVTIISFVISPHWPTVVVYKLRKWINVYAKRQNLLHIRYYYIVVFFFLFFFFFLLNTFYQISKLTIYKIICVLHKKMLTNLWISFISFLMNRYPLFHVLNGRIHKKILINWVIRFLVKLIVYTYWWLFIHSLKSIGIS